MDGSELDRVSTTTAARHYSLCPQLQLKYPTAIAKEYLSPQQADQHSLEHGQNTSLMT